MKERAGEALAPGRERIGQAGHRMRDWAERAESSISHAAREAGERASDAAASARSRMGGQTSEGMHLRDRAVNVGGNIRSVIEHHPLAVGAAALCIGLIGAMAAPSTRTERRVMGPLRDDVVDDVKETVRKDVVPLVRNAAQTIAKEVGDAAGSRISVNTTPIGERLSRPASERRGEQSKGQSASGPPQAGSSQESASPPGQQRSPGPSGFGPGPEAR